MKTTLFNLELFTDDTLLTLEVEHESVVDNHVGLQKVTWRDLDITDALSFEEKYTIEDLIADQA